MSKHVSEKSQTFGESERKVEINVDTVDGKKKEKSSTKDSKASILEEKMKDASQESL